jgi:hypothetical protein
LNLCRSCNQDFGSVGAFDAHRVGKHEYLWSLDAEDGRRCLHYEEFEQRGWTRDKFNRWRQPAAGMPLSRIGKRTERQREAA